MIVLNFATQEEEETKNSGLDTTQTDEKMAPQFSTKGYEQLKNGTPQNPHQDMENRVYKKFAAFFVLPRTGKI